ncbi:hypothetical protein OFO01_06580 [Campylobacter sp. JMF_01 NE2]|uniref:hypothetical protein n=1 Tax=unclassified Campylobacter TaxID=2593542 RepID=UPI0022E9EE85|nr:MULTISPECIES: hypothetical protein [unclassified Campylobacter]MDA3053115.1 hypothetical protein [Campylobacter sp. JMF_03 NE3]MDA3067446.1 hypothetical protein [Campylobacter sp. JMF_01 NE2]
MKIKEFLKTGKAKVVAVGSALLVGANSAMADVSFANGAFSGTIDTTPFTSMAGIVVVLLGLVFAVKAGLRLLR